MTTEFIQHLPEWLTEQRPREGRYVIGPSLGQGGMAEVHEAWDLVLRRPVALKILKRMNPGSLMRFMQEAQIQSRVAHPNICRVYDVESSGSPRIAMQLVRGPTLADAAPDIPLRDRVMILARVSEAVHAAHRLKLIHRDLKPSNILLERSMDGSYTPFVCDFGLAMALDEPSITMSQAIHGTPAYMAPEQIRGERERIGPATDVYALGGTLYYSMFGQIPGGVASSDELMEARRKGSPARVPQAAAEMPRDLLTILEKCLEPEPEHRYESALALAEDLWRFLNGEPILARRVGPWGHVLRTFRRLRGPILVGLAATGFVLAGWFVQSGFLSRFQARRTAYSRLFTLEATRLERDVRFDRMLPPHDLRPLYTRLGARLDALRRRMDALGPAAQGPGHHALGRVLLLSGQTEAALSELALAWQQGFREPDQAYHLARALAARAARLDAEMRFETGSGAAIPIETAQRVEGLFGMAELLGTGHDALAEALRAFLRNDLARAAEQAHLQASAHPWDGEAAVLESLCQRLLGEEAYQAGDLTAAERRFQAAREGASSFLRVAQSDPEAREALLTATFCLHQLQLARGALAKETAAALLAEGRQALQLDPGHPGLQIAFASVAIQHAETLRRLGQDPRPPLGEAQAVLDAALRGAPSRPLRALDLRVRWMQAEAAGALPNPAGVGEGEPVLLGFFPRDHLGDLLNQRAAALVAQGGDPTPVLDQALRRQQAPEGPRLPWPRLEACAESWLIRARWEAGHGLDPEPSLQSARACLDQALRQNPRSASGHALLGLAMGLGSRANPAALEQFRVASALDARDPRLTELRRLLRR